MARPVLLSWGIPLCRATMSKADRFTEKLQANIRKVAYNVGCEGLQHAAPSPGYLMTSRPQTELVASCVSEGRAGTDSEAGTARYSKVIMIADQPISSGKR